MNEDDENLDEKAKREMLLLKGLDKLRKIGVLEGKSERVLGLRMIRTKSDIDVFRSFLHYVLKHMVPTSTWNGSKDSMRLLYILAFMMKDLQF